MGSLIAYIKANPGWVIEISGIVIAFSAIVIALSAMLLLAAFGP